MISGTRRFLERQVTVELGVRMVLMDEQQIRILEQCGRLERPSGSGSSVKATSRLALLEQNEQLAVVVRLLEGELHLARLRSELLQDQRQDRRGDALVRTDADRASTSSAPSESRSIRAAERRVMIDSA